MTIKTHKRKKVTRMHGRHAGTHGWGARKKHKKSGHRGGTGMAGSGKRADQKKTLITKLYGNKYFGKQGVTSRGTKRDKRKRISINQIDSNIEGYVRKGLAKKIGDKYEVNLKNYKILGAKDYKIRNRLIINAKEASQSASESIEKSGGKIILSKKESVSE